MTTNFDPKVPAPVTLTTERLILRPTSEADGDAFAALNADPIVMRHYPQTYDRASSDASLGRMRAHFERRGFGMWTAETRDSRTVIGMIGMQVPRFESHFTPCVEIGWRLGPDQWGKGYATEGARAALHFGFTTLGLAEIVAMTTPGNLKSIAVMERLGMTRNPADDFDNPLVDGPLKHSILYRLRNPARGTESPS